MPGGSVAATSRKYRYEATPERPLTPRSQAVLPGGILTRRPPPPPDAPQPPSSINSTSQTGFLRGLFGGMAIPSVLLLGSKTRFLDSSDVRYGACSALLGSSAYVVRRISRCRLPSLATALVAGAISGCCGVAYNSYRLNSAMADWTEELDEDSGKTFYYNNISGKTTWDKPIS